MRINLGYPLPLGVINNAVGGTLRCDQNISIKAIATDSREVHPGDLFIALSGSHFDGESFLKSVYKSGGYSISRSAFTKGIIHPNPASALLSLAEYYAKTLPIILYNIGITGSVGKSTTKEFAKIILSRCYNTHASEGNYNSEIGMPMSILSARKNSQILLMEMGMNHKGEIEKLSNCLKPHIGLITNVGTAHIGNIGSREAIAKAKLEIASGMKNKNLIIPYDEPLLKVKNAITFSTSSPDADYYLSQKERHKIAIYKQGKLYCESHFALDGEHHRKCLIGAVAVSITAGVDATKISEGISLISRDNIRQNVVFRESRRFFIDFYNSSQESVFALISWANERIPGCKKSLLLGDILELGDQSEIIHFNVGKALSKKDFNNLFLFGEMSEFLAEGAVFSGFPESRIFINKDLTLPCVTANQIRENSPVNEPIFMKASRGVRLERVLNCFKENK